MALVALAEAKRHLRIPDTDLTHDADVLQKVDDATDIILDYLKLQSTALTIASIEAAAAAIVTTTTPHGLTTGTTYTLSDTETTPTINGAQVITVTGPTTFTVPVAVTSGEDPSEGTVSGPTWTSLTVPGQVRSAILLMLSRLYEQRGDDEKADADCWLAIERLLMRSRDPALA